MRTLEPVTFNWFEMELSPIQPYFDFEVRLPEIGNEDLQAPEGFTFTNVTYQDGFLAGSMEPFEPIGGIVIPAGPPGLNPPSLRVSRITGALELSWKMRGEIHPECIHLAGRAPSNAYPVLRAGRCRDVTWTC
jgi:large repetitive protein